MAPVVVYDACVLHPAPLRDLLLRLALTGQFRAKWTDEILDECFRSILSQRPDLDIASLARTRQLMLDAVPECLVRDYVRLIPELELPDPEDRHVLAAAIRCDAETIVTFNLKDFPQRVLARHNVFAEHPDDFLLRLLEANRVVIISALNDQAAALRAPRMTVEEVIGRLENIGLTRFVARVRRIRESSA